MKRGFLLFSFTSLSLLIATVAGIYKDTHEEKTSFQISNTIATFSDVLVLNPVDFPGQEGNIRFLKEHVQNLRSAKDTYDLNIRVERILAFKYEIEYISTIDHQYYFCCNTSKHIPLYLQKRAILI